VDDLFGSEFFVEAESAGHLEDVLPLVILCFRGFAEGNKGAVGVRCRSGAEDWSVGERMIWEGPLVSSFVPEERQLLSISAVVPFGTG
jgi:hypothetical protein